MSNSQFQLVSPYVLLLDDLGPTCDDLSRQLEIFGNPVPSRFGQTRELSPAVVSWPLGIVPKRCKQSKYLGDVEASMVLLGKWYPSAVSRWCLGVDLSNFEPYARYGPLVGSQLRRVIWRLSDNPASRQAVVVLARTTGIPACNTVVQFLVRNGQLSVFVYIRSWDAARGLPYDTRIWTVVGAVVAETLRVSRGRLWAMVASLHRYDDGPSFCGNTREQLGPVPPFDQAVQLAKEFLNGGSPWLNWHQV